MHFAANAKPTALSLGGVIAEADTLLVFTDIRTKPFKHETWMNWPNPAVLSKGRAPTLEISGPGIEQQPLPAAWLTHGV